MLKEQTFLKMKVSCYVITWFKHIINSSTSFFTESQLFKQATYVTKIRKKRINKNIQYDSLGNKREKLQVDRQNPNVVPTRRRKLIKKDAKEGKYKKFTNKNQDQFTN